MEIGLVYVHFDVIAHESKPCMIRTIARIYKSNRTAYTFTRAPASLVNQCVQGTQRVLFQEIFCLQSLLLF